MYTVFGYTDDFRDFTQDFDSFISAIKAFRNTESSGCTSFIRRGLDPLSIFW